MDAQAHYALSAVQVVAALYAIAIVVFVVLDVVP